MNGREKIVIVGGGGHGKVVIDLINIVGKYEIIGIVDPSLKVGDSIFCVEILGDDAVLEKLYTQGIRNAALGVGSRADNSLRGNIYKNVTSLGFTFPTLVHLHAYVSKYAKLSKGVQVMAGACIQPDAVISENSVINTGVVIEHDCYIGNNVFIGPKSVISGNVKIEEAVFIGSGSSIIPNINIGSQSLVAAGAVVIRNVNANEKVRGVPAKKF